MSARATGEQLAGRIALALSGAMWVLPFLSPLHFHPIPTFHGELIAGMLGLGALTAWLAGRGAVPVRLPPTLLLPLALAGLIGLQIALGRLVYPADGLMGGLFLVWAAALVWLSAELRERYGLAPVVALYAWCALIGALASSAVGLFQYYAPDAIGRFAMRRMASGIYANLGQSNHLANQLALGLGSLVYLVATRRLASFAAALVALPMLFASALSLSRSPWLYFLAFAILAAFHRPSMERKAGNKLVIGSACLLAGIALAQAASQLAFLQPSSREVLPMDRLFEVASGWKPRIAVWTEAWEMFTNAPWLGVGFGQFAWHHFIQVSDAAPSPPPGLFDHAHNLFLHGMAELGWLAAAATVLTAVAWIASMLREPASAERWWVLALAAVGGIHSMLEYPFWYAYFLGVAALLAGLADRRRLPAPRAPSVTIVLLPPIAAGWAICGWLYFDYSRLEGLSFNVFTAGSGGDQMATARETLKGVGDSSLLRAYADLGIANAEPLERERLAEKLERNTRVLLFAPTREVAYRQAALLALDGRSEAARLQLRRAAVYYSAFLPTFTRVLKDLERTEPTAIGPLRRSAEEELNESRPDAVRAD